MSRNHAKPTSDPSPQCIRALYTFVTKHDESLSILCLTRCSCEVCRSSVSHVHAMDPRFTRHKGLTRGHTSAATQHSRGGVCPGSVSVPLLHVISRNSPHVGFVTCLFDQSTDGSRGRGGRGKMNLTGQKYVCATQKRSLTMWPLQNVFAPSKPSGWIRPGRGPRFINVLPSGMPKIPSNTYAN